MEEKFILRDVSPSLINPDPNVLFTIVFKESKYVAFTILNFQTTDFELVDLSPDFSGNVKSIERCVKDHSFEVLLLRLQKIRSKFGLDALNLSLDE